jgi:hypothetical protein
VVDGCRYLLVLRVGVAIDREHLRKALHGELRCNPRQRGVTRKLGLVISYGW